MAEFMEALIRHVQQHPLIYDSKNNDFKDIQKKNNTWKAIADILNVDEKYCVHQWKIVRERYSKELRLFKRKKSKNPEGSSGGKGLQQPRRKYFNMMNFLEPVVIPRKTYSYLGTPTVMSNAECEESIPLSITSHSLSVVEEQDDGVAQMTCYDDTGTNVLSPSAFLELDIHDNETTLSTVDTTVDPTSIRFKRQSTRGNIDKLLANVIDKATYVLDKSSQSKEKAIYDTNIHFGLSLAARLSKMSSRKQGLARVAIEKILFEIEFDD